MKMFLDNPALCKEMGDAGTVFMKETFDSRILCEKISERKESLLG